MFHPTDTSLSTSDFDFQQPIYPATITGIIRSQQLFEPDPPPSITPIWLIDKIRFLVGASVRITWDFILDQIDVFRQGISAIPHQLNQFRSYPREIKKGGIAYYRLFRKHVSQIRVIYSNILSPAGKKLLQNWREHKFLKVLYLLLIPFTFFVYVRFYYIKHDKRKEVSVKGKIVVITGAGSGIGERLSMELVKRGATVVLVGKSLNRLLWVAHNGFNRLEAEYQYKVRHHRLGDIPVMTEPDGPVYHYETHEETNVDCRPYVYQIHWLQLDLGDINSCWRGVYKLFDVFTKVDCVVNCAAVRVPVDEGITTHDGLEVHFGVNYLGHFLFTNAILSYFPLPITSPVKIVNILCKEAFTSGFFDQSDIEDLRLRFDGRYLKNPYATSKLLQYYFHIELTKRLEQSGPEIFKVFAVCPPKCKTNLLRFYEETWIDKYFPHVGPKAGVQSILHCLLSPNDYSTGSYFTQCRKAVPPVTSSCKTEHQLAFDLWELSQKYTTRMVQRCRRRIDKDFLLPDPYGNVKFEDHNFYNEICRDPYLPPPARSIIENNKKYYSPQYLSDRMMARKHHSVRQRHRLEVYEQLFGIYDVEEDELTYKIKDRHMRLDLFFDELPRINETNGWMYNLD